LDDDKLTNVSKQSFYLEFSKVYKVFKEI
jgi:hypothetical protein